jgi:hypothetical protein
VSELEDSQMRKNIPVSYHHEREPQRVTGE